MDKSNPPPLFFALLLGAAEVPEIDKLAIPEGIDPPFEDFCDAELLLLLLLEEAPPTCTPDIAKSNPL